MATLKGSASRLLDLGMTRARTEVRARALTVRRDDEIDEYDIMVYREG